MKQFKLYWNSSDMQSDLFMGEFYTEHEANAAIPGAEKELLAQCATDKDKREINNGTFAVYREIS
jgi:hypothetical protein